MNGIYLFEIKITLCSNEFLHLYEVIYIATNVMEKIKILSFASLQWFYYIKVCVGNFTNECYNSCSYLLHNSLFLHDSNVSNK